MRNNVIKLLKDKELAPEQKFNQARALYMVSENANPGLVRGYNVAGYSKQRLSELIYDLKKAYQITDKDLTVVVAAPAKKTQSKENKKALPPGLPEFSKGIKGNQERKKYCAENGIESKSGSTADMDKAIIAFLQDKQAAAAKAEYEKEKQDIIASLVEKSNNGEAFTDELLNEVKDKLSLTDDEFLEFKNVELVNALAANLKREPSKEEIAFQKVVDVLSSGELCPPSFVTEAYGNPDLTEEEIHAIIESAKKLVLGNTTPQDEDSKSDTQKLPDSSNEENADTEKK